MSVSFAPKETILDEIDSLIKSRTLATRPDLFEQVLLDLSLLKFFNTKVRSLDSLYTPIMPLLIDRVLNFYEGAVCCGLNMRESRKGVVVAIIISCIYHGSNENKHTIRFSDNNSTAIPVFLPIRITHLVLDDLPGFLPEEVKMINTYIARFTRSKPNRTTLDQDLIMLHLHDACLMGLQSKDKNVLACILDVEVRALYLPSTLRGTNVHRLVNERFDPAFLLRDPWTNAFYTRWGTAKSFNNNHIALLKKHLESLPC